MPVPFPNNEEQWDVAVRPMEFFTSDRSYTPIEPAGIAQPTLAVIGPTSSVITLTVSAMVTEGDTSLMGDQSSQTIAVFNPDNTEKEQFLDDTAPFDPVSITSFGNQTDTAYNVGSLNTLDGTARGQWPAVVTAIPVYTVNANQGCANEAGSLPDRYISPWSPLVNMPTANACQPTTFINPPAQGGATPSFTTSNTSIVGAVAGNRHYKVWQGARNFATDGSGENPFTTPAFENNGVTFETTQDNDNYTVPEELTLNPVDTNTVYTIGTQCEFTLDGETFVSPWAFTQYTFIAAPELNTVTVLTVGGGGGGRGSGAISSYGGGGGAGGFIEQQYASLDGDIFTITVGAGGGQGSDTSIVNSANTFNQTSLGGGYAGNDGASGGGGGTYDNGSPGGDGVSGQGSNGGGSQKCNNCVPGGGGGGAGGSGTAGSCSYGSSSNAGTGGAGVTSEITGTTLGFAAGGGGGGGGDGGNTGSQPGCGRTYGASGGSANGVTIGGGGGTCGSTPVPPAASTGSGGGGGVNNRNLNGCGDGPGSTGGADGRCIIRYASDTILYIGGTITSITVDGTIFQVHDFTTDGLLEPV
jgi:hypothetical protein